MDKIYFTINGEKYSLAGSELNPETTLNDYLRNYVNVRGTKVMCQEGGCGACIVSVSSTHPVTKEKHVFAVNSCLVHVLSCHEWDITTVEGVGNRKDGYHLIQTRLAAFNGTQCGYCTPGWIMNMYSLYENSHHKLTAKEIENSFAGNMCRCTGYRPILDAFKSLAKDSHMALQNKVADLEDLANITCINKGCSKACTTEDKDWCIINQSHNTSFSLDMASNNKWYKAYNINDIFKVLAREGYDSYRFVAGNTGKGVFINEPEPRVLIDITSIDQLKESSKDVNLVIGAGMPLAEVMTVFQKSAGQEEFAYLTHLVNHLDLVAHVPVRNIGTVAGNLAMKNQHKEFPSDVFVMLATVGATVTVMNKNLEKIEFNMKDYLKVNLNEKLIYNVKLPPLSENYLLRTYKIMPRAQNSHAIMNAGFLFKVVKDKVESANIVFGCIKADFVNATQTSDSLKGTDLFDNQTLQTALSKLDDELVPDIVPPESSPYCRKMIALGLFYKSILSLAPENKINPRFKSGGEVFDRPLSEGTQTFDTDKSLWPLTKPVPKLEALIQCAGEAKYTNDRVSMAKEVFVAFVLSTVFKGDIDKLDATDALKIPGVISFLTAKDIPGKNTFTPTSVLWQESEEEILAAKHVSYYGQPIALVAAVTERLAYKAAGLVKVAYKNVSKKKPVLSIKDALNAPDSENRVRKETEINPTSKGSDTTKVIEGTYSVPGQYHYSMETQTCVVVPSEGNYDVYSSTQWMDLIHVAVANCIGVPENVVNVTVNRVGGGYGGKASRSALVATACALVAYKLDRPARMALSLQSNMAAVGKRQPCTAQYEVGVNDVGSIQYLELKYYCDCGFSYNDSSGGELANTLTSLYDTSTWHITGHSIITDKASNTWCRAPATTEGTAIQEHIMERIAFAVKKDSADVKIINLAAKHVVVKDMIRDFKTDCNFEERLRDVRKYNSENYWRKRGIKLAAMSYPIGYAGNFSVSVCVYHGDGTVAVSHAGIEMGQGINTKVAQVCAHQLDIPLDKVSIKESNNFVSPNAMCSNGSITSECVAYAAVQACTALKRRLQGVKDDLTDPTWEEVIKAAYDKGIDLFSSYMMSDNDKLEGYNVYGVGIAEVELDVLAGTHQVLRVDILEDTGQSLSPEIDVGQIEGAFIMGLGLWTSERLAYDLESGRLLTDRTWTYKPPGAKDIPLDFRVTFKRNSFNPAGVLRSKATGEPALVLAVVVTHALHEAIAEARREYGYTDNEWIHVENPYTVENIIQAIQPKKEMFKIM